MSKPHILHMFSPLKHMSPFDVNMGLDAGFDAVLPYTDVTLEEVPGLVQDAIFSRAPQDGVRTGVFVAGKDAVLALDMTQAAVRAMVPPFGLSVFADPAGSFTTAAAMVACVEKLLRETHGRGLEGLRAAIFGGTGVVAFSAAVILAGEGARATLIGYDGPDRVAKAAGEIARRFDLRVDSADGSTDALKTEIVRDADLIFCAGRAGIRILSRAQLEAARNLLVAADVNAVPPTAIEGLEPQAKGTPFMGDALGIGPYAIGDVKYRTEAGLFRRMIEADAPVTLDFRDAFTLARELAG